MKVQRAAESALILTTAAAACPRGGMRFQPSREPTGGLASKPPVILTTPVHRVLAEGKSAARTTLADVMTPDPDTMPPGKMAIEALRLMEDSRYRHLPIVEDGRVVGIVSRFDFSGIELDRLDEETGLWERI